MAEFRKGKSGGGGGGGDSSSSKDPLVGGLVREARCDTCTHPEREAIDKMLALGTSYTEIERLTGVSRYSVSNHAKRHLKYEEGAIRRIIEEEATRRAENYEEGVSGVLARRVYLETALKQAQRALIEGDVTVEPKDAANIIALLDKQDRETGDAAIDEIRQQSQAFMQAISEVVPRELHPKIAQRAREIAEADGFTVQSIGEPEVIEAAVVDENS